MTGPADRTATQETNLNSQSQIATNVVANELPPLQMTQNISANHEPPVTHNGNVSTNHHETVVTPPKPAVKEEKKGENILRCETRSQWAPQYSTLSNQMGHYQGREVVKADHSRVRLRHVKARRSCPTKGKQREHEIIPGPDRGIAG